MTFQYRVFGAEVCRETFCAAFGVSVRRLRTVRDHMMRNGLTERVHGGSGRKSTARTAVQPVDVSRIHTFLQHVSAQQQEQLSNAGGALASRVQPFTASKLHQRYQQYASGKQWRVLGVTRFVEIARKSHPELLPAKRASASGHTPSNQSSAGRASKARKSRHAPAPSTRRPAKRLRAQEAGTGSIGASDINNHGSAPTMSEHV